MTTHQQAVHVLRESERIRLEQAREAEKNTARLAGHRLVATDRAGRQVVVELDASSASDLRVALFGELTHGALQ